MNWKFSALFCLIATGLGAQTAPPESTARVGVVGPPRELSLPEAIQTAFENNPAVEVEKLSISIAEEGVEAARGAFDPTFSFSPSVQDRALPVSSVLQGGPEGKLSENFFQADFSAVKPLAKTGGNLSFEFANNRQSSSNVFTSLNPFIQSQMFLTFRQPLLRNREIDLARTQVLVSQKNTEVSGHVFEQRVVDVVADVLNAYWNLVFARRDLEVRQEAIDLARRQLEMNQRLVDAGSLAPIEISAAEAELERRRGDFFSALNVVSQAENRLRTLIADNRDSPWWSAEILPSGGDLPMPPLTPLGESVDAALRRRPELKTLGSRMEINELNQELQANQLKPRLDLIASYGQTGLAGGVRSEENPFSSLNAPLSNRVNVLSEAAGLPPLPPGTDFGALPEFLLGGYGSTLSNMFDTSFRTIQVGVQIDLTPRNRAAQAGLAQAALEQRQLRAQRRQTEMLIEADVRNAVQSLDTARQRLSAARAAVRARQNKLESETRLFQTGESTNFLVLTRQNEYSEARATEVRARAEQNIAISDFHRSIGQLLETWSVAIR